MEDADLYNAGLMFTNLEGADLSNAEIRNANLKYAIFDENTNLSGIETNSITIDNLTESALKANWGHEVKQVIMEKYLGNSFVLKTTSFFKKEYQEKYRKIVMEKTGVPEKVFSIHAIIDSTIEGALEKVDRVEYFLPSHPGDRYRQIKTDYKDKFQLKDLAYGQHLPVYAKVYLKGKDEPIELQEYITLKESGPSLL